MQNNKVLKSVRYALKLQGKTMVKIFELAGLTVPVSEIGDYLKKEDDPTFKRFNNKLLHGFLNGLIIFYRGPKDGVNNNSSIPFIKITKANANNMILKKLKIALDLKSDDVQKIFKLGELDISPSEISAVLRNEDSKNYRECGDKYLRRFLKGLVILKRGVRSPITKNAEEVK